MPTTRTQLVPTSWQPIPPYVSLETFVVDVVARLRPAVPMAIAHGLVRIPVAVIGALPQRPLGHVRRGARLPVITGGPRHGALSGVAALGASLRQATAGLLPRSVRQGVVPTAAELPMAPAALPVQVPTATGDQAGTGRLLAAPVPPQGAVLGVVPRPTKVGLEAVHAPTVGVDSPRLLVLTVPNGFPLPARVVEVTAVEDETKVVLRSVPRPLEAVLSRAAPHVPRAVARRLLQRPLDVLGEGPGTGPRPRAPIPEQVPRPLGGGRQDVGPAAQAGQAPRPVADADPRARVRGREPLHLLGRAFPVLVLRVLRHPVVTGAPPPPEVRTPLFAAVVPPEVPRFRRPPLPLPRLLKPPPHPVLVRLLRPPPQVAGVRFPIPPLQLFGQTVSLVSALVFDPVAVGL